MSEYLLMGSSQVGHFDLTARHFQGKGPVEQTVTDVRAALWHVGVAPVDTILSVSDPHKLSRRRQVKNRFDKGLSDFPWLRWPYQQIYCILLHRCIIMGNRGVGNQKKLIRESPHILAGCSTIMKMASLLTKSYESQTRADWPSAKMKMWSICFRR